MRAVLCRIVCDFCVNNYCNFNDKFFFFLPNSVNSVVSKQIIIIYYDINNNKS